jgi:hypothetical protein
VLPVVEPTEHICSHHTTTNGDGMTYINTTSEIRTVSTPTNTDNFRYRYGKTELAVLADRRLTANDQYRFTPPSKPTETIKPAPLGLRGNALARLPDALIERYHWRLPDLSKLATSPSNNAPDKAPCTGFRLQVPLNERSGPTPERTFTHNKQFSEQTK